MLPFSRKVDILLFVQWILSMVELGCGLDETASSYEMGALTFEWLYKRECKVIEGDLSFKSGALKNL